jgi:hypothetical protein
VRTQEINMAKHPRSGVLTEVGEALSDLKKAGVAVDAPDLEALLAKSGVLPRVIERGSMKHVGGLPSSTALTAARKRTKSGKAQ